MSIIVRLKYPPPVILCHLFDALVLPVLEYGGEVWGWNNCNAIELIHRKFCKFTLNLPSSLQTCYSELGRMPLYIRRNFQMIKYWAKLANCSYSPLLYNFLVMQVHESLKWASYRRELFNQCGLPYLWTKVGVDNSIPIGEIKQMLHDQYLQEWSSSLSSTSGKLRLYKLCKYEFKRELYLQLPMHLRCILSRLRLSCHSLLIETGRYRKPKPIPVDERKCIFCNMNAIEDEIHFCEFYQKKRRNIRILYWNLA